jgi:sigma-B regulation protein RsbU (phosphoserine phosphatase)
MPEISIQTADGARERYAIAKGRVSIGRSRESDIFLPDQWLSRHHAEIVQRPDGYYVADLQSKNGTLLNGLPVKEERRLREGDVITLGEHTLTFVGDEGGVEEEFEPEGTQVFSVRELSDINTKPAIDPAELQRQNRVLAALSKAASELVVHRPLDELFVKILDLLFESVAAERGAILLLEGEPPLPRIKASKIARGEPLTKVSRSIGRRVMEDRVALLLPNVLEDARFKGEASILSSGIRSAMCAPLWFNPGAGRKDDVLGFVYLDSLQRSHSFGEEDLRILTALANVAAAKIENVRLLEESLRMRVLEEDMRVAAEIQTGLLPRGAPEVPGYGLVGCNLPCRTVGGDYYDFDFEAGRLRLVLGDVSGKGTGAALIMTVLRAAVRSHWTEPLLGDAVIRINRTVSGRLAYVNAGHNPPLLIRADGTVETLREGGMVLGMFDTVPYQDGAVDLRPGDTVIVYSDGVTETWNPAGDEFGEEGLLALVVRSRALEPAALQAEILRELERFAAGAKATDDRTLIVLKRH